MHKRFVMKLTVPIIRISFGGRNGERGALIISLWRIRLSRQVLVDIIRPSSL